MFIRLDPTAGNTLPIVHWQRMRGSLTEATAAFRECPKPQETQHLSLSNEETVKANRLRHKWTNTDRKVNRIMRDRAKVNAHTARATTKRS